MMKNTKKHPVFIGYCGLHCKPLYCVEDVANFIIENGVRDNVTIYDEHGNFFLDTFGIFLNKIADMEYRKELLEILVPMQMRV